MFSPSSQRDSEHFAETGKVLQRADLSVFRFELQDLFKTMFFKKVFTIFKNQKNPQNSSKRPSRLLRNLEEFPRTCQEALKPQQNPPNHFNPLQNPLNLTHLYEFNNETLQTSET